MRKLVSEEEGSELCQQSLEAQRAADKTPKCKEGFAGHVNAGEQNAKSAEAKPEQQLSAKTERMKVSEQAGAGAQRMEEKAMARSSERLAQKGKSGGEV
jgi:hypothetical protein